MKRGRPTNAIRAVREDYAAVLVEAGIDEQWVQSITTNTADLCPMPDPCYWIMVKPSAIHGQGLFSFLAIGIGDCICPVRLNGKRTPAGRCNRSGASGFQLPAVEVSQRERCIVHARLIQHYPLR